MKQHPKNFTHIKITDYSKFDGADRPPTEGLTKMLDNADSATHGVELYAMTHPDVPKNAILTAQMSAVGATIANAVSNFSQGRK